MLFNSADYIIFFITVLVLYYVLPHKLRWIMLLIASIIFYMAWEPALIILILFSSFVNYASARLIYKNRRNKRFRKGILILCMVINFGLLTFFKYLMFLSSLFLEIFGFFGVSLSIGDFNIILPMGISFYTFQAAAYTIDVYRGELKPVKNYLRFTLFITFFPQLVAGPIERAKNLLSQLFKRHSFDIDNIIFGVKFMALGYFKKVVIADRIAVAVDTIFNSPESFGGISFIAGALLFTVQIFCDFSGYSDIAIGTAKTLGINLMTNFDRPYFSRSIKEFWRRWHISLSGWFKDYVYIPLGGNRVSKPRWALNIFITFVLSGIWHGANLTFIVWGALHGAFQIIGKIKDSVIGCFKLKFFVFEGTRKISGRRRRIIPIGIISEIISGVITFCLVAFAWIFFRANTLGDAFYIVSNLASDLGRITDAQYLYETVLSWGLGFYPLLLVLGSIGILFVIEAVSYKENIVKLMDRLPFIIRFCFYFGLVFIILGIGVFDSGTEFIYFQF
ncbi:MAG: MBOAT family protein [Clostridiales bacterium]|nr:MBOAT family protein [Clostridiales bacterium]